MRKSIKRLTAAVLFMSITVSSTFFLTACKNNDVSSKNKIVVFNYGDYIDSTLLDKFEKETGIKVSHVPHRYAGHFSARAGGGKQRVILRT